MIIIEIAIKEIQMFNQDFISLNCDVWFSQAYITVCFINDDQKEHLLSSHINFKFGALCQTRGKRHIIYIK